MGNDDQPRGDDGRWTSGGGSTSRWAERIAAPFAKKIMGDGGVTYKPGAKGERIPKTGIMVGVDSEKHGKVVEVHEVTKRVVDAMKDREPPPTREEVRAAIDKEFGDSVRKGAAEWLKTAVPKTEKMGPSFHVGGWLEKDAKGNHVAVHFDVSQRFESRHEAIKVGRERNQVAVWDLGKFEEIPTGGTGR